MTEGTGHAGPTVNLDPHDVPALVAEIRTHRITAARIKGRIVRYVASVDGLVPGVTKNLIDGILSDLDHAGRP